MEGKGERRAVDLLEEANREIRWTDFVQEQRELPGEMGDLSYL
jgi:hypothetical protein